MAGLPRNRFSARLARLRRTATEIRPLSFDVRFCPGVDPGGDPAPDALLFAFRRRRLLVRLEAGAARVPDLALLASAPAELGLEPVRRQYLGQLDERQIVAAELDDGSSAPEGWAFENLRRAFTMLPENHLWLANRAIQIVDWDRDHQFCSRCASATEEQPGERSKKCPQCGLVAYPRLSPAVIVLVERGDEILLARSPHFLPGVYSTLAGFVDPGETLEQTVAREIFEEVGVQVDDVRYFGSQPWPFPNSLMIGFRARWVGGELKLDPEEIEDAGWFTADNLPKLPARISIARALIEAFLAERSG